MNRTIFLFIFIFYGGILLAQETTLRQTIIMHKKS